MDLWSIGGGGLGQSVMKLIWCSGLPWIYGQLEEGGRGQSVMKIIWCNGLPQINARLMGGPSAKVGLSAKFELIYISCFASQKVFLYYI